MIERINPREPISSLLNAFCTDVSLYSCSVFTSLYGFGRCLLFSFSYCTYHFFSKYDHLLFVYSLVACYSYFGYFWLTVARITTTISTRTNSGCILGYTKNRLSVLDYPSTSINCKCGNVFSHINIDCNKDLFRLIIVMYNVKICIFLDLKLVVIFLTFKQYKDRNVERIHTKWKYTRKYGCFVKKTEYIHIYDYKRMRVYLYINTFLCVNISAPRSAI